MANDLFVPKRHEIDGILVGGPSPTKDEFSTATTFTTNCRTPFLASSTWPTPTNPAPEGPRRQRRRRARRRRGDEGQEGDGRVLQELNAGDLATYGFEPTRRNLMMGSVDRLPDQRGPPEGRDHHDCPDCGTTEREVVDRRKSTPTHSCTECGTEVEATDEDREDAIDHLIDIAEQRGTETKFISTDFEKGEQLLNAFGGFAGILRYSTGV